MDILSAFHVLMLIFLPFFSSATRGQLQAFNYHNTLTKARATNTRKKKTPENGGEIAFKSFSISICTDAF